MLKQDTNKIQLFQTSSPYIFRVGLVLDMQSRFIGKLDKAGLQAMVETKHILIETDGVRFRIVEVEDPRHGIPTVRQVTRSDGTRWIDAAGKGN